MSYPPSTLLATDTRHRLDAMAAAVRLQTILGLFRWAELRHVDLGLQNISVDGRHIHIPLQKQSRQQNQRSKSGVLAVLVQVNYIAEAVYTIALPSEELSRHCPIRSLVTCLAETSVKNVETENGVKERKTSVDGDVESG
ncbi:hypothetical protein DFH06DRAFT_1325348 [Mycena polygramma]|nr:hypothetical protein DFH06DRAFT_1325348 [Mycena polygramma]